MKSFLTFAILIGVLYSGWVVYEPQMDHYFLDAKINDMAGQGRLHNQPEMLTEIMRVVSEKQIPIGPKDIRFRRTANRMRISVDYVRTVSVPFYSKTYHFTSEHTGLYDPKR